MWSMRRNSYREHWFRHRGIDYAWNMWRTRNGQRNPEVTWIRDPCSNSSALWCNRPGGEVVNPLHWSWDTRNQGRVIGTSRKWRGRIRRGYPRNKIRSRSSIKSKFVSSCTGNNPAEQRGHRRERTWWAPHIVPRDEPDSNSGSERDGNKGDRHFR